jgi:hypothetical protein
MPIEKRPASPLPKGPRPGSRNPPYKVTGADTLETVASKHSVSTTDLIRHNFATTDPAEINWYLREYVGCDKPTSDGKNWCFSSSANPGLIYIPASSTNPGNGAPPNGGGPGVNPPTGGPNDPGIPLGTKLALKYKFPVKTVNYLLVQVVVSGECTVIPKDGSAPVIENAEKLSMKVSEDITSTLQSSLELGVALDDLTNLSDAVRFGEQGKFVSELAKLVQFKLTATGKFGWVNLKPAVGLEASMTPAVFELGFNHEGSLFYDSSPYKYSATVKVAMKVGLSKKGWLWIANRIGRPAVRAFAEMVGPEMAATLSGWGIFVIIGTVGALAFSYLTAWAVQSAWSRGELEGAVTWYAAAYCSPLFHDERVEIPSYLLGNELVRKMVELGERDLINDMQSQQIDVPTLNLVPYRPDSRIWRPAWEALHTYLRYLLAASQTSEAATEQEVRNRLDAKARSILGI